MYWTTFLLGRLIHAAVTLLCVLVVVIVAVRLIPGDPVEIMTAGSPGITQAQRQQLRAQLGLSGPLLTQVVTVVERAIQGDLGELIRFRRSAAEVVLERLPATIELTGVSMFLALLMSLPIGILAALRPKSIIDYAASAVSILGVSIPSFVLGVVLIVVFSLYLRWLPVSGRGGDGVLPSIAVLLRGGGPESLTIAVEHLILPSFALAFSVVAWNIRLTRSSMLGVLGTDYVRFARAKGLSEYEVVIRHAFRNAVIPTITIIGLQLGYLLSGAFVIENVFAWPGVGRLAVQAIDWRDYPLVQTIVVITATMFLGINITVELLYQLADPRIRRTQVP